MIKTEEFLLLYDVNTSKNKDLCYSCYENFDVDEMNDDECLEEFRFFKNDIFLLAELLNLPQTRRTYNIVPVDSVETSFCLIFDPFMTLGRSHGITMNSQVNVLYYFSYPSTQANYW